MKMKIEVPPGEYALDEVRIQAGECQATFDTPFDGQLTFVLSPSDFTSGPASFTQGCPEKVLISPHVLSLALSKPHFDELQTWLEPYHIPSI